MYNYIQFVCVCVITFQFDGQDVLVPYKGCQKSKGTQSINQFYLFIHGIINQLYIKIVKTYIL